MAKEVVSTAAAPSAVGPYSQGVRVANLLFVSGQVALDPQTGKLVAGDIRAKTRQVLKNLGAIVGAAGSSLERVAKTTVYLREMRDFAAMNEVYAEFFGGKYPARATVQVSRLPLDAEVEIDLIAEV